MIHFGDRQQRDDEHQWLKRQSDNLPLAPAPEEGEGEDEGQTTAAGFAPPGSGRPGRRPARPWFRCPRYQRRPFFCYYWGFSRFSYYPCCPPPRFPPGPPRPFPYRAEGAQANAAAEASSPLALSSPSIADPLLHRPLLRLLEMKDEPVRLAGIR